MKSALKPVRRRALMHRINRAQPDQQLMRSHGSAARDSLGDYYVVAGDRIIETHVDLAKYARRVGALRQYEFLVGE